MYLATDDEEIWNEAKKNFEPKGFVFVGDSKIGIKVFIDYIDYKN